ncbi:MAG: DUF3108 domain-containing protein [Candidatus Tectomicrobia bacterium]|nr:DUF3108 domain-containing protein [Candidatus Tectomicrobia bacterium]
MTIPRLLYITALVPRYVGYAIFVYVLFMGMAQAESPHRPLPFHAGEELTFKVSWLGISVGTAMMKIEPHTSDAGESIWRLISTARSLPFFDAFHKVDDYAESLFDPRTRLPSYFFIRQHEGRRRSRYEMIFDQPQRLVTYRKRDKPARFIATKTDVQDPLSVLYRVRSIPLTVGQSIVVPLFNKGKTWMTEVRVLQRERLKLPVGKIDTIKIQPLLREAGIFHHKGDMFVWLTDDAQRVPVQLRSDIKIGAVKARLVQAKGVDLAQAAGKRIESPDRYRLVTLPGGWRVGLPTP